MEQLQYLKLNPDKITEYGNKYNKLYIFFYSSFFIILIDKTLNVQKVICQYSA